MVEILEAPPVPCVPQLPALDEKTRRVLSVAKGIIAKQWGRGTDSYAGRNGYCILGATNLAGDILLSDPASAKVQLALLIGAPHYLAAWNDAPGRTQEEVVALFDRALTSL